MASLMASRLTSSVAFRSAAVSRPVVSRAVALVARPSSCSSSFLGGSFGASALAKPSASRGSLTVVAAGGKSMACTLEGTRRKRRRTSGYRTRVATKAGRKIIKARRARGRHSLAPASERSSGGKKP